MLRSNNDLIKQAMQLIQWVDQQQCYAADQLADYRTIIQNSNKLKEKERILILKEHDTFQQSIQPEALEMRKLELQEIQKQFLETMTFMEAQKDEGWQRRMEQLQLLDQKISASLCALENIKTLQAESLNREVKESYDKKDMKILLAAVRIRNELINNHFAEKQLEKLYSKKWIKKNPKKIKALEQIVVKNIAQHLTKLCKQEFSKMLSDKSMKEQRSIPTSYFNHVDHYVQHQILEHPSPEERVHVLSRWIHIANECLKNGDFHTLVAIYSSLRSDAIYRLEKTWHLLDIETHEIVKQLDTLCKSGTGLYEIIQAEIFRRVDFAKANHHPLNVIPFFGTVLSMQDRSESKEFLKPNPSIQKTAENLAPHTSSSASIGALLGATPKTSKEKLAIFYAAYEEIRNNTVTMQDPLDGIQKTIYQFTSEENIMLSLSEQREPRAKSAKKAGVSADKDSSVISSDKPKKMLFDKR